MDSPKFDRTELKVLFNERRKAVRSALNNQRTFCKVDINKIHHHFSSRLSTENLCECPEYSPVITESQQVVLDSTENLVITKQEVAFAVSKIAVDTAPGPGHVLVRALKDETCYEVIAMIASTMLTKCLVQVCLKQARTVLIYKGGDEMNLENWRPITICTVVRRVIERILDFRLRALINFCENQRGFINSPGTLINTSILESVLVAAKSQKKDVTLVFLDISKAFDSVGYKHLQNTLLGLGLPSKLSNLIVELQRDNSSPLSPSLYSISTDHILEELSTHELQEERGFSVSPGLPKITSLGFADDTVIVARNEDSARVLVELAITIFNEIGLNINIDKCKCISVTKGFLNYKSLDLISGQIIPSIVPEENIKYLGVSYHTSTVFDALKCMEKLKNRLDILASTPLLQHHQKYSVLCSYICPTLIYQFKTTPLNKIPAKFLSDADVLIKTTLKEILQLLTDRPDNMLYADIKYKGLGLFKSSWGAFLQHINACQSLQRSQNIHVNACRNLSNEIGVCLNKLGLQNISSDSLQVKKLRQELMERAFQSWCSLNQKGKGVILYKEFTPANKWIRQPDRLTSSEWRQALKMTANVCPLRAIPGRSRDGNHCRRCVSEIETLGFVLGAYPFSETLRNSRLHRIRSMIAEALRKKGLTVHEEVHGISQEGSCRRIDMLAIPAGSTSAYFIDPTVRVRGTGTAAR
ncbi:hypothetical protein ANN_12719 [Periplaneta americana]|uniref:Reverse transcriptase domain-containing protein n=1 Tax=Periplaneta americana TaxID=6978 RepID=A0ABQ8TID2_PERAM|nr:hypothetical protein ANN_12719 [Periplaneta americana]